MKRHAAGMMLVGLSACAAPARLPSAAAIPPASTTRSGLSSRELARVLFKGNLGQPDVTVGELPPAQPFMPPPPPPAEPDYSGALDIEWQTSDGRMGPGRWAGGGEDFSQQFTLVVRTTPPQRVALGRWHYGMCMGRHSLSGLPSSELEGVAQLMCTGNGAGLSFTLVRRGRGETVDVMVHEGSDGLDGPTYRQGIAAQVRIPRRRAIHMVRRDPGEADTLEEERYYPFE